MKNLRTVALTILACVVLFGGIVAAQVAFLQPVQLQDIQTNGTNLRYFNKAPSVHKWNFTGVSSPSVSGYTMTIPSPVQGSTDMGAGCSVATRGTFSVLEVTSVVDGGVKDVTYQCCRKQGLTYAWVAQACN